MNRLITIMNRTISDLNFLIIMTLLGIFVYSFVGMMLYGKNYVDHMEMFPDGDIPRYNFTDFLHSFIVVFRAFCGEWIESMWDCMLVGDITCVPFFLCISILGNLFVSVITFFEGWFSSSYVIYPIFYNLRALGPLRAISRLKQLRCEDDEKTFLDHEIIPDRMKCISENYTWENSEINFDHVGNAYIALFQKRLSLYTGGSIQMLMTDGQRKFYNTIVDISAERPTTLITKPKEKLRATLYDICTSKKLDITITVFIGINMIVMMMDYYGNRSYLLDIFDIIFLILISCTNMLKIFVLKRHFFDEPWNIFDLVLVVLSIAGLLFSNIFMTTHYFTLPMLVGLIRVVRVLRLIKDIRGIRTQLYSFARCLPAFFNILLLLFIVMCTYAIFGMFTFRYSHKRAGIDDLFNFRTFGQSMILLFQMKEEAKRRNLNENCDGLSEVKLDQLNEETSVLNTQETAGLVLSTTETAHLAPAAAQTS
ncbi:hypothetical protein C0J52_22473 [Blattella germanica]|nr:hypothetical protein C0J52_22473 [Blattella germanica]